MKHETKQELYTVQGSSTGDIRTDHVTALMRVGGSLQGSSCIAKVREPLPIDVAQGRVGARLLTRMWGRRAIQIRFSVRPLRREAVFSA